MKFPARAIRSISTACLAVSVLTASAPASAYLFWVKPDFARGPVKGTEPGIVLPLQGGKPAEVAAALVWGLRAGLNVAALQCQFSPALMTVNNYNNVLKQHDGEFDKAQVALTGYFKRTSKGGWQRAFDAYTTRTYNGYSTLHGQIGFCDTAGSVGRDALGARKGKLYEIAENRLKELRSSLMPAGDRLFAFAVPHFPTRELPSDPRCWKKGTLRPSCSF